MSAAGGQKAQRSKSPSFRTRAQRDPREVLTITVKLRGGPECWYEVHARGCTTRVPGHTALHDLMSEINQTG